MKRMMIAALIGLALLGAAPAQAECYADYKAKQDSPLRLHYGVMQVPDDACNPGAAAATAKARLQSGGWTLLNVLSIFGPEGLSERKASAGDYYLRY